VNSRLRGRSALERALIASALGVLIGAGLLVWTRTEILSLRYRLGAMAEREAVLRREVEKLRVDVAGLSAAKRIEPMALELGLRYPAPGQVVQLSAVDVAGGTGP
jgi:hypothetical protein